MVTGYNTTTRDDPLYVLLWWLNAADVLEERVDSRS
jgi:hypothetical protein